MLRVQALGGVPQVLQGMSVTEGQLLISGVEDTGTFGTRFTAGLGSVEGRTWYTPDGQRAPHRGRKTVYRTGKAAPFRDFRQPQDKILCKQ